jgi:hypothetical protein
LRSILAKRKMSQMHNAIQNWGARANAVLLRSILAHANLAEDIAYAYRAKSL